MTYSSKFMLQANRAGIKSPERTSHSQVGSHGMLELMDMWELRKRLGAIGA